MKYVIGHGKNNLYTAVCQECGCVYSFNDNDVFHTYEGQLYTCCPECSTSVITNKSDMAKKENATMQEQLLLLKKRVENAPNIKDTSDKNGNGSTIEVRDVEVDITPNIIQPFTTEKEKDDGDDMVNHPKHYQHPSGVECITVARWHSFNVGSALKYLWRAGLKHEEGMSDEEKEIQDIEKAVWFLKDEIEFKKKQLGSQKPATV